MNTLGSFIESEAFFPILILLLLLLIGVFIWLVLSNKKQERMYREKKQNIEIDESAQIKIIDEGYLYDDQVSEEKNSSSNDVPIVENITNQSDDIFDEKDKVMQDYKKEMQDKSDDIVVPGMFVDEKENIEVPQAKEEKEELSEEEKKIIEAFELPNLKSKDISDDKLEQEIIKAANEYISSVMHKNEEKEEEAYGQEN